MHLVGFDAAGETVELRLTARDRSRLRGRDPRRRRLARTRAARTRHPRLRPHRRRAHRSRPHRCLKGPTDDPDIPTDRHRPRPTTPPARCCAARSPPSSRRSRADGTLDEAAFRRLVRWQILAGIDGLVPCGTTGESPTLSPEERERLIATTVEVAAERPSRDRIRVVAGTGTNDTAATIRATRRAAELGADAALVVAPYYNRPDGRMLDAHFRAIADEGDLPIVVYNVPSRTGTNVDADTFLRLAEHPRIVAIKEASGNLEQIARICRDRPRDVAVLAGDDAWTLPVLAMGGDGVVSVASNEIPGELVALCAAAHAGDLDGRPTDPRTLAAAVPRQLPRRPEPGPGQGRAASDGPARLGHGPGAAPARSRQTGVAAMAGDPAAARAGRGGRWPDLGHPDGAPDDDPGGGGMSAARSIPTDHGRSTARRRPIDPATFLADLEAGRLRAAEPDPTAPGGWRVRPDVKTAILACFADRTMTDSDGRPAASSATAPRSRRGTTCTAGRGGSCPAARPSAAAPTSATASS